MELKEILKNKKVVLIAFLLFIVVIGLVLFFLLREEETTEYPEKPVLLNNIGTSDIGIEFEKEIELDSENYPLYETKSINTSIQTFMSSIGIDYAREETLDDNQEKWSAENSFVSFDKTTSYLQFSFESPVNSSSDLTTSSGISSWMEEHFGMEKEYEIVNMESQDNGDTYVYADMKLGDIKLEFKGRDDKSSLFLILNDSGDILGGAILLLEFAESKYTVPVIDAEELSLYINNELYPKDIVPDFSGIYNSIGLSYLSNDWIEIKENLDNCSIISGEIIYLYADDSQKYVLPVYKLESVCEVTYNTEIYSVPSVVYTNAVDPDYVSTEE